MLHDRSGKYTLVLDGSPPDVWDSSIVPLIYGVDASQVSVEVWREWVILLQDAPIQLCAFPETLKQLEPVPKWLSMLRTAKIPPLCKCKDWHLLNGLEVLCLRNELLSASKWSEAKNAGLLSLPKWILDLRHLRWLDLSMNSIQEIPQDLQGLLKLQALNIANTDLKKFPDVLLELTNLQQLFIRSTNASLTREWLNELSRRNTNLYIQRLVQHNRLSLWDLCLDSEQRRN